MFEYFVCKGFRMNFVFENILSFEIPLNRNIGAINVRILQVEATMLLCMPALFVRNLHNRKQFFLGYDK